LAVTESKIVQSGDQSAEPQQAQSSDNSQTITEENTGNRGAESQDKNSDHQDKTQEDTDINNNKDSNTICFNTNPFYNQTLSGYSDICLNGENERN
jgi:hypothetical protein